MNGAAAILVLFAALALGGCTGDYLRMPAPGPGELVVISARENEGPCTCENHASTAPAGTRCRECKWWPGTSGKPYCRCWYDWITAPQ